MLQEMQEIVEYLREHYRACVELCGKDDDVNTIPAKKMYQKALKIYGYVNELFKKGGE